MENKIEGLNEEYEHLKERIKEIEKLKEMEIQEIKGELEEVQGTMKETIYKKDIRINELQEQLGDYTAIYHENLVEIDEIKKDHRELNELIKFREETGEKERKEAGIIIGQKKKIDYLETQYKEEATIRKK